MKMKSKLKTVRKPGHNTLLMLQRKHPHVTSVQDADEDVLVEVTNQDDRNSKKKNHAECALATACKRQEKVTAAVVSVSKAYIIRGNTAIRYDMPESASREVVSYDRNGGFAPGKYKLRAPCPASRLENLPYRTNRTHSVSVEDKKRKNTFAHRTSGIRTSLNRE